MKSPSVPKRYEVRSLLGEGGSGRVYRVQDSIRDRELALKLVTPAESAFLRREFDTLRQIRHENLIQVFDWGALPSGEAYYTMELIEGGDWAQRMGKPQPAEEVRRVLTGLLRGLAHLHCHGEIHGDLKPGNILLGAGGVVKITDAGMGGSEGRASGLSGTPGYTAPEVWEGSPADIRSDLYSVGGMAYEALTGKHPFLGHTVREVVSGQLEGWVPSPGAHGVQAPADLERVVMRALERQPGLRQGSADEFMEGFGVEDRIGEILGGKLVGREKEITEIEKLLYSEEPGTPTLLYITGEPGIGKTALMEEVGNRVGSSGLRFLRTSASTERAILDALSITVPANKTRPNHQSSHAAIADVLWTRSTTEPLLLWIDPPSDSPGIHDKWFRNLCRVIWAMSLERNESSRVFIAITASSPPSASEAFERVHHLKPLSSVGLTELLRSVLGSTSLVDELIQRIHALTGGNPGAARSCLTSLIDRNLITRQGGTWLFQEKEQIKVLELPINVNPWSLAWSHLDSTEQRAIAVLALLPRFATRAVAAALGQGVNSMELFASLEAKGWLRRNAGGMSLASEAIRHVSLTHTSFEHRQSIVITLLTLPDAVPGREARAELSLEYCPTPEFLEEGIWASQQALLRGEHRVAEKRLRACLAVAERCGDLRSGRLIAIDLAETLHQLGEDKQASDCLSSEFPWLQTPPGERDLARRAKVRGTIESSQGNMDEARRQFHLAAQLADAAGETSLALQSHAALAELEWRHEAEAVRAEAIKRVRGILGARTNGKDPADDRANLTYQLGAALILSGDFSEAGQILLEGMGLNCSDYWRMRLSNALASAAYYKGDFDSALMWVNNAWQHAEQAGADSFKARILASRAAAYYGMGRPGDAVDQHRLAALWARRIGLPFEYLTSCAGQSISLLLLARYEEAIAEAIESGASALQIGDLGEQAKSLELEALGYFYVGDYEASERTVDQGRALLHGRGYNSAKPRLDWLRARLLIQRRCLPEAEKLLREAEAVLLETRDWEDLPGVQIELHILRSLMGDDNGLHAIGELTRRAVFDGALIVQLYGAGAIAEILLRGGVDHAEYKEDVAKALGRADQAGIMEVSWRLTYALGEMAATEGNQREAHTRFRNAVQMLNQIADRLTLDHRKTYLGRPHTRSALDRISLFRA